MDTDSIMMNAESNIPESGLGGFTLSDRTRTASVQDDEAIKAALDELMTSDSEYNPYIPTKFRINFAKPVEAIKQGSAMLNLVDLAMDHPIFARSAVSRSFTKKVRGGVSALSEEQRNTIKSRMEHVESEIAKIVRKVTNAIENGKIALQLSLKEEWLLKQFCVVLKFQSKAFFDSYLCEEFASGNNDPDSLAIYNVGTGFAFSNPVDLWYNDLMCIFDAEFTIGDKWARNLERSMTSKNSAFWAISTIKSMYPMFCLARDKYDEFILTENSHCISEGPRDIKEITDFHHICVLSPKLALILREWTLPESFDNGQPLKTKRKQKALRDQCEKHLVPEAALSLLHDLPAVQPRMGQYGIDGVGRLAFRTTDASNSVSFPIILLEDHHVRIINDISLEYAFSSREIIFTSPLILRDAVASYLTRPIKGIYDLKTNIAQEDEATKLKYLRKLELVAIMLEAEITPVYKLLPNTLFTVPHVLDAAIYAAIEIFHPTTIGGDMTKCAQFLVLLVTIAKTRFSASNVQALNLEANAKYRKTIPEVVFNELFMMQNTNLMAKSLCSLNRAVWTYVWDVIGEIRDDDPELSRWKATEFLRKREEGVEVD